VPDQRGADGFDGSETGGDEEGSGKSDRRPEPGGALEEECEEPGDEQRRDAGVRCQTRQPGLQHGGGIRALLEFVHGECGTDDGDHGQRHPRCFGGDAQDTRRRAVRVVVAREVEHRERDEHGSGRGDEPGAHCRPSQPHHEHEDRNDGSGCQRDVDGHDGPRH
jgi:hypothetical protein